MEESIELPITHEITLKLHKRLISALDIDRSGARLVTGGHDHTLGLWDFAGMDDALLPFRHLEPSKGYPIKFTRFSPTGDALLVGCTGANVKLLDRNGAFRTEFHKGDPYLRDMKNTKGHVNLISWGEWHPTARERFASSGMDGTVRFWNCSRKDCEQVLVVKPSKAGQRVPTVNCFKFLSDRNALLAASNDGSLRVYPENGPWLNASQEIQGAHQSASEICSVAAAGDLVASRGMDDCLRLWDLRNLKSPVGTVSQLTTLHEETMCIFSPDSRLIVTGTSVKPSKKADPSNGLQRASLLFFDSLTLEPVEQIAMGESSVVTLNWHPVLNQIFCGMGDGGVEVLYSPEQSQKGIMTGITRPAKKSADVVFDIDTSIGAIYNPHALPLFRNMERRPSKKLKVKNRKDALKHHLPDPPSSAEGHGQGGRLGTSVTQTIMKGLMKDTTRDEDPREALLRYAEIAEKDPKFVSPAYAMTQPKTILDPELLRKEEVAEKRRFEEEADAQAYAKKSKK